MENVTNLPAPEKIRFVGPVKDSAKIDFMLKHLEAHALQMPAEEIKNFERIKQLYAITAAVLEFGRNELGLDLSKRMPKVERFRFFSEESWFIVRKMYALSLGTTGVSFFTGDMFVKEERLIEKTLGTAQHELIHVTSHKSIHLSETSGSMIANKQHEGYWNCLNGAMVLIYEALTEITNIQIMLDYWKKQPSLNNMNIKNYGKIGGIEKIIILDEVIRKVARKRSLGYKDVLRHLQRGKFLGQMQALRILTDEVGKSGMKLLAKGGSHANEVINIARAFSLDTAEAKLEYLLQGKEVQVMEDLSADVVYRPRR